MHMDVRVYWFLGRIVLNFKEIVPKLSFFSFFMYDLLLTYFVFVLLLVLFPYSDLQCRVLTCLFFKY